jgi:hypothetical protein
MMYHAWRRPGTCFVRVNKVRFSNGRVRQEAGLLVCGGDTHVAEDAEEDVDEGISGADTALDPDCTTSLRLATIPLLPRAIAVLMCESYARGVRTWERREQEGQNPEEDVGRAHLWIVAVFESRCLFSIARGMDLYSL